MKIGIVALGLIGGSLLKKLINFNEIEIFAVTRNKISICKAKELGANASSELNTLKNCDIVFVCTPINKTIETLDKLENIVSENCIVTDVASVKEFVIEKERPYKFIGSHPMAGTENNGFDASFENLFEKAKWVLTPTEKSEGTAIESLKNIIKLTGAIPIITTAKEHDFAVAQISHLPMLISQALFASTENNSIAKTLASSGFRDTTRLAMTNPVLASDMLNFNKKNIEKAFDNFIKGINEIEHLKDNQNSYLDFAYKTKISREEMYSESGKNVFYIENK